MSVYEEAANMLRAMHGVAWFDPTVPRTDGCSGWHLCQYDSAHEGPHRCRHCGSTCEQGAAT